MIEKRTFESLGRMDIDWLSARFHFSFGDYYDPNRMNWGQLRVWNDDRIQPGGGFARHGHCNMEIISYIRSGAVTHRDHLGNEGRIEAGNVQVMSAGKGILHEEHNFEKTPTDIFQIWLVPSETDGTPYWETREFPRQRQSSSLIPLASGRAVHKDLALPIRQDAAILGSTLAPGQTVSHELEPGRLAYVVSASGMIEINGTVLDKRDGAAISGETELTFTVPVNAGEAAEFVLADIGPAN